MWFVYALLSAVFAAAVSIRAKAGIENVNSNLATAIRTAVVLIMAWLIVFASGRQHDIPKISARSWGFLIASGIATGLSWLCYFRAIQIGSVSKVVPVDKLSVVLTLILAFFFLHETIDLKTVIGAVLITAGTLVLAIK